MSSEKLQQVIATLPPELGARLSEACTIYHGLRQQVESGKWDQVAETLDYEREFALAGDLTDWLGDQKDAESSQDR